MIFDCDYYNTPISEGYQNTDGSLISPIMDFSNEGSVILAGNNALDAAVTHMLLSM